MGCHVAITSGLVATLTQSPPNVLTLRVAATSVHAALSGIHSAGKLLGELNEVTASPASRKSNSTKAGARDEVCVRVRLNALASSVSHARRLVFATTRVTMALDVGLTGSSLLLMLKLIVLHALSASAINALINFFDMSPPR